MNFDEIQELIENIYLGKIETNHLLALNNETYICFVDYPTENKIEFGVYNSLENLSDENKIADLGTLKIESGIIIYMEEIDKISQSILNYLKENELTVIDLLYEPEDYDFESLGYDWESVKQPTRFKTLCEEIIADLSIQSKAAVTRTAKK